MKYLNLLNLSVLEVIDHSGPFNENLMRTIHYMRKLFFSIDLDFPEVGPLSCFMKFL